MTGEVAALSSMSLSDPVELEAHNTDLCVPNKYNNVASL